MDGMVTMTEMVDVNPAVFVGFQRGNHRNRGIDVFLNCFHGIEFVDSGTGHVHRTSPRDGRFTIPRARGCGHDERRYRAP